jgi:uncharacterized protein YqgC (DUF456 family)
MMDYVLPVLVTKQFGGSRAVSIGAFLAFIVGSGAKLIVSSLMLYYAVKAMF